MASLSNWSASMSGGDFCAPSAMVAAAVAGVVTGHPSIPDGRAVRVNIAGATPTTVTDGAGVVYTLSTPDPLYADWCVRFQCMVPTTTEGLRTGWGAFAGGALAQLPVYNTTLTNNQTIGTAQRSEVTGPITIPSGVTLTIAGSGLVKIYMDDYWRIG